MKKQLANIDMRIQVGGVVLALTVVTFLAHMFVVSPESAKVGKIQSQIDATQAQIYQRRAALKSAGRRPTIEVADLFKLSRAMPDRPDMPGVILTLSEVAREAGISFDMIEPVVGTADTTGSTAGYKSQRIHLLFNGDFYGLSDFLYRLRSLVAVHDGKLAAAGRLFNTDTVIFNIPQDGFPKISAELYVNAYVYQPAATPTTAAPGGTSTTPTTTTTTMTPESGSTPPSGATAAGVTG